MPVTILLFWNSQNYVGIIGTNLSTTCTFEVSHGIGGENLVIIFSKISVHMQPIYASEKKGLHGLISTNHHLLTVPLSLVAWYNQK